MELLLKQWRTHTNGISIYPYKPGGEYNCRLGSVAKNFGHSLQDKTIYEGFLKICGAVWYKFGPRTSSLHSFSFTFRCLEMWVSCEILREGGPLNVAPCSVWTLLNRAPKTRKRKTFAISRSTYKLWDRFVRAVFVVKFSWWKSVQVVAAGALCHLKLDCLAWPTACYSAASQSLDIAPRQHLLSASWRQLLVLRR